MFKKELYRCEACGKVFPRTSSCDVKEVVINGIKYPRIKYGSSAEGMGFAFGRCVECGVMPGNYHHWNCCLEICPRCERQLLSCECDAEVILTTEFK